MIELKAAHRLRAEQIEEDQRMKELCVLMDDPAWHTLTSALWKNPNEVTASQKVEALDLWKKVQDLGMVKTLTKFLTQLGSTAKALSKELGLEISEIIQAFQTKPMLAFFKAIKFSFKTLLRPLKAFGELYKAGILKVFAELHNTKVFQALHSGALKVDELLNRYPLLRRLTGPAIAGLLLWMWLSASFSGSPELDIDLTAMMKAALGGQWSAAELFTSKEGLVAIGLLLSGLFAPVPSPVWLSGGMPINLLIALCYTAFKHLQGEAPTAQKIKKHMKFGRVS
jgi:hypothetical protein